MQVSAQWLNSLSHETNTEGMQQQYSASESRHDRYAKRSRGRSSTVMLNSLSHVYASVVFRTATSHGSATSCGPGR